MLSTVADTGVSDVDVKSKSGKCVLSQSIKQLEAEVMSPPFSVVVKEFN
jgi:hypothetical protein